MTDRSISEKQLQKEVINLAKAEGWRTAHFGNSVKIVRRKDGYKTIPDKNATGFPDLILVRPPRVMAVELKGKSGILTDEQMRWLEDLDDCNIEVAIWRPRDWENGIIKRRLK